MPAGTVLFSSRAPIGYVAIAANPVSTNQGFKSFVLREGLEPEYVYYYLQRAKGLALELASGTTFLEISGKQTAKIPFVVAPREEQHRIVEAIESYLTRLDAAVASLKRAQQNLKRYRASVLKAAVEGRLVPTEAELAKKEGRSYEPASELLKRILVERRKKWIENAAQKARAKAEKKAREAGNPWTHADDIETLEKQRAKAAKKYKEPTAPDLSALSAQAGTTNLPTLPEGWCWETVESVAEVVDPQPSHRTPPVDPTGIPYVGIGDVLESGHIDREAARKVPLAVLEEHQERYTLRVGDFIFGKIGTLGRPILLDTPFDYTLSANVVLVQPSVSLAQRYVFLWMRSPSLLRLVGGSAAATSQPAFGIKKIRTLPIPVPPLQEQERIVQCAELHLNLALRIGDQAFLNQERCQRLRQSILKYAFEGKLVEQDPNDEPASSLLERIKTERSTEQSGARQ